MSARTFDDALLESMRAIGDPPADRAVAGILDSPTGRDAVNALLRQLADNDELVPAALPEELRALLVATERLPSWADPERIVAGQELFSRFGPQIVLALHCAALPSCYAGAKGAETLYLSSGMTAHTGRRIIETAQFVLDVMAPGGLSLADGSAGIRTAQKVRLLHAAVRHFLRAEPRYRPEWGEPINQEDLAGTLMSFSVVTLGALERLGVDFTPDEEEAYVHAWRAVGYFIGVDERLLPGSADEARRLWAAIRARQFAPSEAGRELMRALVGFMEHVVPGTLFDGFCSVLVRELVGDDTADMLGVERGDWTRALFRPLRFLVAVGDRIGDRSHAVAKLTGVFGRKLLEGLLYVDRGGNRVQFRIPPSLRGQWGLAPA